MSASRSILAPGLFLLLLAGITAGFIQEIIFHEKLHENGNYFGFRSSIPDTTAIAQFGPFSKICFRGEWRIYAEKNYMNTTGNRGSSSKAGDLTCYNGPLNFQSARHYIASETEEAAISLYRNGSYSGPEILVTVDEFSGIEMPVESFVWSAASSWTLFQGQYFNGNSTCLPIYTGDSYIDGDYTTNYNLTTVGSVLKTCDPVKIREAMQKYNAGA